MHQFRYNKSGQLYGLGSRLMQAYSHVERTSSCCKTLAIAHLRLEREWPCKRPGAARAPEHVKRPPARLTGAISLTTVIDTCIRARVYKRAMR